MSLAEDRAGEERTGDGFGIAMTSPSPIETSARSAAAGSEPTSSCAAPAFVGPRAGDGAATMRRSGEGRGSGMELAARAGAAFGVGAFGCRAGVTAGCVAPLETEAPVVCPVSGEGDELGSSVVATAAFAVSSVPLADWPGCAVSAGPGCSGGVIVTSEGRDGGKGACAGKERRARPPLRGCVSPNHSPSCRLSARPASSNDDPISANGSEDAGTLAPEEDATTNSATAMGRRR